MKGTYIFIYLYLYLYLVLTPELEINLWIINICMFITQNDSSKGFWESSLPHDSIHIEHIFFSISQLLQLPRRLRWLSTLYLHIAGGSKTSQWTKCNISKTNRDFLPKFLYLKENEFQASSKFLRKYLRCYLSYIFYNIVFHISKPRRRNWQLLVMRTIEPSWTYAAGDEAPWVVTGHWVRIWRAGTMTFDLEDLSS